MLELIDSAWEFLAGVISIVALALIVMVLMNGAHIIVKKIVGMFSDD